MQTTPAAVAAPTRLPDVDVLVVGAGQAGLAAGQALRAAGLTASLLEAGEQVGGAWPRYYDSLTLFSPASRSALPGLAFPGDPSRYPHRDEVRDYLRAYAAAFELPVTTGARVHRVERTSAGLSTSLTLDGVPATVRSRALVAASGGFGRPHVPALPGAAGFGGRLLHVADYRRPEAFSGRRVLVVGAGNSAVQVAVELADVARVSLASRRPVRWRRQRPLGIDVHHWVRWTGLDAAPLGQRAAHTVGVLDDGRHRAAFSAGRLDRRPLFTRLTPTGVRWSDGVEEDVDAVVLATGYRPDLGYLAHLVGPGGQPALAPGGAPVHRHGVSRTVPGLGFVGLPGQRGLASATLRGVGPDARRVVRALARQLAGE